MSIVRSRTFGLCAALSCLVLLPSAVAQSEGESQDLGLRRTKAIYAAMEELIVALKQKTNEKIVMVGKVKGSSKPIVRRALQELLLRHEIERANTEEEILELREQYKRQGVDIYKNREFQALLRASENAKLTLEVEAQCESRVEPTADVETCVIWLRGLYPATLAFAEHRSFDLSTPREIAVSPYATSRSFLLLLLAYAFIPPLLHRLDLQGRKIDGRWRSPLLFPIYLVGNRVVTFVAVLSFALTGPFFFERWVSPLPSEPTAVIYNTGYACAAALGLHIAGCLFVSMWRDSARGRGYRATFSELFVLHPRFWTRELEGSGSPPWKR